MTDDTREIVLTLLKAFDSPDEVADYCLERGFIFPMGQLHSSHCPIAQAVQAVTGDSDWVACERFVAHYVAGVNEYEQIVNPPVITQFIRAFDSGAYPLLRKDVA